MGSRFRLIDVALTLDTSIYAAGDVLSDVVAVSNVCRNIDEAALLRSLTLLDEDDQAAALDIYLLSANVTIGAFNGAPSISDANARNLLAKIAVAAADYVDLGGVRVASYNNLDRVLKPVSGTRDIYVAAVNGAGTPTYTVNGLRLRLGVEY